MSRYIFHNGGFVDVSGEPLAASPYPLDTLEPFVNQMDFVT